LITLKKAMTTALLILGCYPLTSCGNDDGSDLVDINVTTGIILDTDAQSCVDLSTATDPTLPPVRSLTAPNLSIRRIQVDWKPTNLDLYVGLIRVTLKSPKISGGKFSSDLSGTEIEALLGAQGSILTSAADADHPHSYVSTNLAAVKGHPAGVGATNFLQPCGLGIGGVALVDPTSLSTFTAQVQIQLIGTAYNADQSTQKTVIKSIYTTAKFL
jgi:hypothetical protein